MAVEIVKQIKQYGMYSFVFIQNPKEQIVFDSQFRAQRTRLQQGS